LGDLGFVQVEHLERNFFAANIIQALTIPNSDYLVVLDSSPSLYVLDLNTLVLFKLCYLEGVTEISPVRNAERPNCIWCLFRKESTYFAQVHIPTFEIAAKVPASSHSTLANGACHSDYAVAYNSHLEIFEFVNSDPKQIIHQHAKRKDVASAILFMKEKNLDILEYHKEVLRIHLDLSLDEIRECISQINDPIFLSEYALEYCNNDLQKISQVFSELRRRIQVFRSIEAAQIMSTLTNRLATFCQLKSKQMTGLWKNDWNEFKLSNMLLNIQNAINDGDVTLALTLWRRHCHDDKLYEHIKDLLYSIPAQLNVDTIILILDEFKYSVAKLPWTVSEVIRRTIDEWAYHASAEIEQLLKNPDGALQLLEEITGIEPCHDDISISPELQISYWSGIAKEKTYRNGDFFKSIEIRKSILADIVELRKLHSFSISLSSYEEQSPSLIGMMN
jgi:hypothetical protein